MDSGIVACINARTDFFNKYYTVPAEAKPDVEAFFKDIYILGQGSANAQDFEAKFASLGYQNRLNTLLTRCTPKSYQMTAEEKRQVKETAKQIYKEDRKRIIKSEINEAVDHVAVMAEEDLIANNRKQMIEKGIYDDYTRANNAVDIAKDTVGLLSKLFKRKK